MALGAGVGEEAAFRALLQTATISAVAASGWGTHLGQAASAAAGVAATSVAFGALHALTPTYFWFAAFSGALFGAEYLALGLPAAAATHAVYDWIALVWIVHKWGSASGTPPPLPDEERGRLGGGQ